MLFIGKSDFPRLEDPDLRGGFLNQDGAGGASSEITIIRRRRTERKFGFSLEKIGMVEEPSQIFCEGSSVSDHCVFEFGRFARKKRFQRKPFKDCVAIPVCSLSAPSVPSSFIKRGTFIGNHALILIYLGRFNQVNHIL